MIGRIGWALGAIVLWAAALPAAAPRALQQDAPSEAAAPASPSGTRPERPFSPLHDFLGIDPQSGEFVDPPARSRREAGEADTEGGADDGPAADAGGAAPPGDGNVEGPAGTDEPSRQAEAATEAVRRLTEQINDGSLDDLSRIFGDRLSSGPLSGLSRQIAWLTAGLLCLYPLSMVIAEVFGAWLRRHDPELTDLDRSYRRTRLIRRLLLSGCWIALIILGTVASLRGYWWGQPQAFTLFCVALGGLGIAIATLTSLIKESAKHYSLTMLRQMRREQLEIRADLDELCKRMRQVTMTRD